MYWQNTIQQLSCSMLITSFWWTKSEKQLKDFMNELNYKRLSIKFDCKQIEFIDQQNKLQTTVFRIPSDRHNFVNAKLEHSLKKSIPYS